MKTISTWCSCLLVSVLSATAADRSPNIIFLITDDQHHDQANFLSRGRDEDGQPKNFTPNIDRLAREGVVLSGLHSPSPLCVPSRFCCLTGNYASRATNGWMVNLHKMHGHTFVHQEPYITPSTPNIAKDLKRLGYVTGAVGKNHVIDVPGYRKVDAREELADPRVLARLRENQRACEAAYHAAGFDFAARIFETNPIVIGPREIQVHNLDWIHEAALEFLDKHHDRPFFLYYAVTVPHRPYNGWKHNPLATPIGILSQRPGRLPPRETIGRRLADHGLGDDRGDMLWLDDCVGSLLDKLKSLDVLDNTVIVYANDHGDDGGKTTCYQGGMATFGFVFGPPKYIQGGRVTGAPCSLVDLAPTIVDLCGGRPVANRYDGVTLKPVLTGEKQSVRDVIYGEMGHTRTVNRGKWKYLALRYSDYHQRLPRAERLAWLEAANEYQRSNRWTTFENNNPDGPFGHSGFIPDLWDHEKVARASYANFYDADQLYDLEKDPREQNNLAADPRYADVLRAMKQELKNQLGPLPGGFAEFKPATEPLLPMADRIRIGRELMKDVFH